MAKQSIAFKASDGTNWDTLEQAVAHEVDEELNEMCGDEGHVSTRVLALHLIEPKNRRRLVALLEQLK